MKTPRLRRTALLALLPLLALSARAQQGPDSTVLKEGVRAAVEVTAMDLDVVATKDGKDVTDLKKDEVTVHVDGKAYPLDYFARIDEGTVHGPDLATASPDVILETLRTDTGNRFVPRQFLIFFDDEHLLPWDRKNVIEALRDFVTRLTPSDDVALVSYNIETHVIVPFTSSKEALIDGLDRLEKVTARGLFWNSQFIQDRNLMVTSPRSRGSVIHSYSEQILVREQGTLEELRRAVAALAARSGKRTLLYVSSGLELHPGQTLAQTFGTPVSQFDYSVTKEFGAAIAEANRSGVTMSTLDARGLSTNVDASEAGHPVVDPFFLNATRREALEGFAQETGGIAVENRNTFKAAMDQIYREASSYYSVGITLSSLDAKRKEHTVAVATTRPGVTIRTRRGYAAKSASEAARDRLEMALMTPAARGEFPVSMAVGAAKKGGGLGRRLLPFEVRVPLSELTFTEEGGKKKATVEISMAAVEDTGARSTPVTDRRTIVVDKDALEKASNRPYVFTGEMKSGKGNIRFVTTVRDVATNRVGIGSASVRVE